MYNIGRLGKSNYTHFVERERQRIWEQRRIKITQLFKTQYYIAIRTAAIVKIRDEINTSLSLPDHGTFLDS